MRVLIAGCGYVGTALGVSLLADGAKVWGLRRSEEGLKLLSSKEIEPIMADLLKPESLLNIPTTDAVVFCQAISSDLDNYHSTYVLGTRHLLSALGPHKPKILFISSTSVYGTHDGSRVDETTDPASQGYPNPQMAANAEHLLAAEKMVLDAGGIVFRLAGIYGPGRHRLAALKSGKMKPSFSNAYTNRIHRDDVVEGLKLLIQKGRPGEVYIGADDDSVRQKDFYTWLCERLGMVVPESIQVASPGGLHLSDKRCLNNKIKALGLRLKYPSFRDGYAGLIRGEK